MTILRARNVTIGYPGKVVLRDLTFQIDEGQFIAVCGPNGAGKTTLLKSLAGVVGILGGNIEFGFDQRRHPLGYVPQRETLDSLFPLTVADVVMMGRYGHLGLFDRLNRSDFELALESLAGVGLAGMEHKVFADLSGGQRQRALIARALCTQPKLVFLDEPTSGTDPGAEKAVIELLCRLHRERALTIVMVSHHLDLVRAYVPSAMLVRAGEVSHGPTAELLDPARIGVIFEEGED